MHIRYKKKKVHIMHTDMGSRVILSPILLLIALVIYIKIYAKFIHDTETIPWDRVTIKAYLCDINIFTNYR